MPENQQPLYEGLFLINPQALGGDLSAGLEKVREILQRSEAEILALHKWDERRLAYTIEGQKRGVFLLGLFRVKGDQIARIERNCHLTEEILRVMITRGDHLGEVEIEQAIEAAQATTAEAQMRSAGESSEDGEEVPAAVEQDSAEEPDASTEQPL